MKRRSLFSLFLLLALPAAARAEVFLRIVQPFENAQLPSVSQSFVFGSVVPATAAVAINGVPVRPHTNGGFLVMIPFQEGKFLIQAVASDGVSVTTVSRTVFVAEGPKTYPMHHGKIHPVSPMTRVVLRPGENIEAAFHGAPGGEASFKFTGRGETYPMQEQQGVVQGIYKGVYNIQRDDDFDNDDIVFILKRRDGKKLTQKAGAKVTVQRRKVPRFAELREDAVLLTGPSTDFGYNLFLLVGTRLEIRGEWGDYFRVFLDEENQGWVRRSATVELPPGTFPARSVTRNLRVSAGPASTTVEIPLQFRHPHRLQQFTDPHRLTLTLYGVVADSDRIRYKERNGIIKEVSWYQKAPEVCELDIQTIQRHAWGYDVRYEGTTLILEIRHRPPVQKGTLKGLKIAVDAGHSRQSFGTIGPWGNTEASVNLMAARAVKSELEKRGAQVVMIQDGTQDPTLQQRVDQAWSEKAHLFISIHADACGEGQNPRDLQGYSIHYFHPQSRDWAQILHEIYGARTKFQDQGLWRSNLAVCRTPHMPALLMEQAFLILPEYEEILISPKHHRVVAESIGTSLMELFRNR